MSVEQVANPAEIEIAFMIEFKVDGQTVRLMENVTIKKIEALPCTNVDDESPSKSTTADTLSLMATASVASEQEIPDFEDYVSDEIPGASNGQSSSSSYTDQDQLGPAPEAIGLAAKPTEPVERVDKELDPKLRAAAVEASKNETDKKESIAPRPIFPPKAARHLSVHSQKCQNHPRWPLNRYG